MDTPKRGIAEPAPPASRAAGAPADPVSRSPGRSGELPAGELPAGELPADGRAGRWTRRPPASRADGRAGR